MSSDLWETARLLLSIFIIVIIIIIYHYSAWTLMWFADVGTHAAADQQRCVSCCRPNAVHMLRAAMRSTSHRCVAPLPPADILCTWLTCWPLLLLLLLGRIAAIASDKSLFLQTEYRGRSVCLCVCLFVTFVSPAKTAEPSTLISRLYLRLTWSRWFTNIVVLPLDDINVISAAKVRD